MREDSAAKIRAEITGLERLLGLEPRSRVLDLACGNGRRTIELARRGHRVLGIDSSEDELSLARRSAREERLNIHFLQADPSQIPYSGEFDAIVALSGAFGRISGARGGLRALESARRGLKPGALLLIDQTNRERLLRSREASRGRQSFDLESGCLGALRLYALTELKDLLARAGLAYLGCWGDFDNSRYALGSPRMIVLSERPAEVRPERRREEGALPRALRIKGRG
ncbi:MAG: class I SAM-dependent methyltransferase [Elusimicrobia bacterium]|nr:class I SAM-dependent methyltransferase [Elusimicrobiota bacterium]MDE2237029.1 class I SAM-dependent methyltransferase [Elusimicrobiota bacterium]MDE2425247.1 class I SAM-dependent methyltransferase [Elusimicrobiota bacterium]